MMQFYYDLCLPKPKMSKSLFYTGNIIMVRRLLSNVNLILEIIMITTRITVNYFNKNYCFVLET